MRNLFCLISIILLVGDGTLWSQTLVYEDLFTTGTSHDGTSNSTAAFTSGTAPNNTSWRYTEFDTGFGTSWNRTASNDYLILQNEYGVNEDNFGCNLIYKGGDGYYTAPGGLYEQSASFTTTLTNNTQSLEWTFNFRSPEAVPQALTNGGAGFVGGAFVLGLTSPTLESAFMTTQGYAVIFGDASGAGNYVKLVKVNGGVTNGNTAVNNQPKYTFFNWNGTNTTSCVISDNVNLTTSWYSIKVQYNPINDVWRLFVRNDGGTIGDPQTLNETHCKGANFDNTYTGVNLPVMGFYGCLPDATTNLRTVRWDNLRIKQNVSLIGCPVTTSLCGATIALPVGLEQMSISCDENNIALNWSTVSELNNESFSIEKSTNGEDFVLIGQNQGAGNSQSTINYSFIDPSPYRGTAYYRLSQTDYNGIKTDLGTLSSEWPCEDQSNGLQLFPNPTDGDVNLVIQHDEREHYTVEIYSAIGQLVIPVVDNKLEQQGSTLLKLNTSDLSEGIFLIRVIVGEKVYSKKLIIKK